MRCGVGMRVQCVDRASMSVMDGCVRADVGVRADAVVRTCVRVDVCVFARTMCRPSR